MSSIIPEESEIRHLSLSCNNNLKGGVFRRVCKTTSWETKNSSLKIICHVQRGFFNLTCDSTNCFSAGSFTPTMSWAVLYPLKKIMCSTLVLDLSMHLYFLCPLCYSVCFLYFCPLWLLGWRYLALYMTRAHYHKSSDSVNISRPFAQKVTIFLVWT